MLSRLRSRISVLFARVVLFFKLKPVYYTFLGLVFSSFYFIAMYYRLLIPALLLLLLSGLMDVLDGLSARLVYTPTRFGAFIDSIVDRVEDSLYVIGLLFIGLNGLLVLVALALTLIIPYMSARARSAGLNVDRETSVMERSDRIISLTIILLTYMAISNIIVCNYMLVAYVLLAVYNLSYNIVSYWRTIITRLE